MPEDEEFMKRAAAALAKVMASPFDQTHGVPKETTGRRKRDRPSVKVGTIPNEQAKPASRDHKS